MTQHDKELVERVARAIKSEWLREPSGQLGINLGVAWITLAQAAIAAMGDASTRKDEGSPCAMRPPSPASDSPSEIRLLDPDMPDQEMRLCMGEMTAQEMRTARAAIYWANSYARFPRNTTEPVLISLEKCMEAMAPAFFLNGTSLGIDKREVAKAVLDAAGVPYAE